MVPTCFKLLRVKDQSNLQLFTPSALLLKETRLHSHLLTLGMLQQVVKCILEGPIHKSIIGAVMFNKISHYLLR